MTPPLALSSFREDFLSTIKMQATLILTGVPLILGLWVFAAYQFGLEVVFAARAGLLSAVPIIVATIFFPFFTRKQERQRVFIVAWFVIAIFFNLWWECPQVFFASIFREANQNMTLENLPLFIAWWGYASADLDYFNLSRFFFLAELSFWPINMLAVIGLYHMYYERELKAMLWFCMCGTMQAYNVICIFIPHGGIVDQFHNIASDSWMAIPAYWVLNLLWAVAAGVVIYLSSKRIIALAGNS